MQRIRKFFSRLAGKKVGLIGGLFAIIAVGLALAGPSVAPYGKDDTFTVPNPFYDPMSVDIKALSETEPARLADPSWEHPFGTDQQSRDLLTRLMYGARPSVTVGVLAALLSAVAGSFLGIVSGYFGSSIDLVLQRFVDALLSIPGIVLLLLIVQTGSPSLSLTIVALAVLGISPVVRLVRSSVLSVKGEMYVEAARSVGASDMRVMARHVLPNVTGPIIVVFSMSIGVNILAEAGLSFLGLSPPGPSWGKMVNDGRPFLQAKPILSLAGGGAITLTVLGFNLLGDALRDVLDPRQRGKGGAFC